MKRVLITAGLPYANGEPHIGHGRSTYLPADIYCKFLKQNGYDVIYVCGTDEHGTPIIINAEKAGKSPAEFVKYWHDYFKKTFERLGIGFDIFYKTHSKENLRQAQEFFNKAKNSHYLYEKEVEQYYCEKDRKFLPDRYVKGTCPYCSAKDQYSDHCESCGKALEFGDVTEPKCVICGSNPVLKSSKHYFFTTSVLGSEVKKYLQGNKELQSDVKNYVLHWIKEGLRDWDITRDLSWGVPVPGEKGKVLYVWWDAPIGYISSTQKWAEDNGKDWKLYWKNKNTRIVHFIGKDIIYHHYLFWPAMLLATGDGYNLPSRIPVRGFLNLEGRKFSKSRNWYIPLKGFLDKFPADYLRYYLTSITPNAPTDANFSLYDFKKSVNEGLIGDFGNLARRVLYFIEKEFKGAVPRLKKLSLNDKEVISKVKQGVGKAKSYFEKIELMRGLKTLRNTVSAVNKYFQAKEPWKTKDPNCLNLCANFLRSFAIVFYPVTPFSCEQLWKQLGLKGKASEQSWVSANKLVLTKHKIKSSEVLFKPVTDKELEEIKNEFLSKKDEGSISLDDFKKIKLRVGKVINAERINDKLLKLRVKADRDRAIVAGVGEHYKPEELIGQKVIVLVNLAPKKIGGVISEGMVLAAEKGKKVSLLTTIKDVEENAVIL